MKRLFAAIGLIAALAASAHALIYIQAAGGGGGSCATAITTTTGTIVNGAELYAGSSYTTEGQSFVGDGKTLCKLYFYVSSYYGAPSIEIRVDDDTDMTSEFMGAVTPPVTGVGEVVADFESQGITLQNGVTYYFFVRNNASGYSNRARLGYFSTNPYAGGVRYMSSDSWVVTSTNSGHDKYFKVDTK